MIKGKSSFLQKTEKMILVARKNNVNSEYHLF